MEPFGRLNAVAAPLGADDLDTDQVFPARFFSRDRGDGGYGRYFLHDLRFDAEGKMRPGFVLNDPAYAGARILVAAANYGCGSGRPGAVFSHLDYGIRAVIAESFGPVFSAVAYKSGLLTIALGHDVVAALREEIAAVPGSHLTIDLPGQRIASPAGIDVAFEVDPFVKRVVGDGVTEVELTLGMADAIAAMEARRRAEAPWLFGRD